MKKKGKAKSKRAVTIFQPKTRLAPQKMDTELKCRKKSVATGAGRKAKTMPPCKAKGSLWIRIYGERCCTGGKKKRRLSPTFSSERGEGGRGGQSGHGETSGFVFSFFKESRLSFFQGGGGGGGLFSAYFSTSVDLGCCLVHGFYFHRGGARIVAVEKGGLWPLLKKATLLRSKTLLKGNR